MKITNKKQIMLIAFLIIYGLLADHSFAEIERSQSGNQRIETDDHQIHVGVILDMGSREGKIISSCIHTAISDFYGQHKNFSTRIVLHTRNSVGEPVNALTLALDLLDEIKVQAIIGGQTRMEARLLAELGDKSGLPFISISEPISYASLNDYSFLLQITQDEVSQFKGMAAIVEAFNWRAVILIYEEIDLGRDDIYMINTFQEKNINVNHKIAISASFTEKQILDVLHRCSTLQSTIFVVHMSRLGLVSQLLINAKKVGMMTGGYAWLLTVTTTNALRYADFSVIESMQGIVGLKSYIPASKGLCNLTSRLRRQSYFENPNFEVMELGTSAVWAYDSIWALAEAAESSPSRNKLNDKNTLDQLDLQKFRITKESSLILKDILQSNFTGLSGQFQIINGKLLSPHIFEIVNFIGKGDRRVGFFTHPKETKSTESKKRRRLVYHNDLDAVVWPGGSTTIPKGRSMMQRKLRILVPQGKGFHELVRIDDDNRSNSTIATGFCIDVFKAAANLLEYQIDYEFIPMAGSQSDWTYDDLILQVFHQNYDAVVGDVTITSNRSLYVDFTFPFSDLGVGMLVRRDNKNMWIFLKPLSTNLWITTGSFFLLIGFVVWVIEHPINKEFQGSISKQLGTSLWFAFSTLVFAHKDKLLSNLSKFVVIVWVFVVLILTSSYTATLASMMTVRRIQINGGENLGYYSCISCQFNFKPANQLQSVEEFAEALSKGSKRGGVSAIIDEIPYIKAFLSKYGSDDYSMVKYSGNSTNGFGFVFPKGSPLVRDMSIAIMKLRETGVLENLERVWFNTKSSLMPDESSKDPNVLNLETFRGLFIMSGFTSTLALFLFLVFYLQEKRDTVKNYLFLRFRYFWLSLVATYYSNSSRVHNRVYHEEEMNKM